MDKATQDYVRAMGKEVQALAHDVSNTDLDLEAKYEALMALAFRAGAYADMAQDIRSKFYS
jgi:hypothetical protein